MWGEFSTLLGAKMKYQLKKEKNKKMFAFDLSPDMQLKFPPDFLSQIQPPPTIYNGTNRKMLDDINTM